MTGREEKEDEVNKIQNLYRFSFHLLPLDLESKVWIFLVSPSLHELFREAQPKNLFIKGSWRQCMAICRAFKYFLKIEAPCFLYEQNDLGVIY
jgi:CBS domain containing-hemolysin-like protein